MSAASQSETKEAKLPTKKRFDDEGEEIKVKSKSVGSTSEEDEDVQLPHVVSPNAWESADLGDVRRKDKFLRLMGAAKKEHTGKFVIGDTLAPDHQHGRLRESEAKLEAKLESQFKQSMSDHLKQKDKRHRGLGFDPQEEPTVKRAATAADQQRKSSDSSEEPQKEETHVHFVSQDGHKRLDL